MKDSIEHKPENTMLKIIMTMEIGEEALKKELDRDNLTRATFVDMVKTGFAEVVSEGFPQGTKVGIEIVDQEWLPASGQCQKVLMRAGQPYPRTCAVCGLGPCHFPSP